MVTYTPKPNQVVPSDFLLGSTELAATMDAEIDITDRSGPRAPSPHAKYDFPQTEAQEVGWHTMPLMDEPNPVFRHPIQESDITKHESRRWFEESQWSQAQDAVRARGSPSRTS